MTEQTDMTVKKKPKRKNAGLVNAAFTLPFEGISCVCFTPSITSAIILSCLFKCFFEAASI